MDAVPAGSVPLSLAALLESLAARLDRLHDGLAGVRLRAVPVRPHAAGKVYGGFVYAQLRDAATGEAIDARVPEGLAAGLEWNREAVFAGLLRFKPGRGGVLKLEFRVDAVEGAGPARLPGKGELLERWRAAAARPKRDVRGALQGGRPRVVVITGVGSVAVDDVRSQLREAEGDIDLAVVRVAVTRPADVARAVREAAAADLVVITRGGGEDVHLLDDDGLIGAVAAAPVPVAVAVGHAADDLVLGRVADADFPTPTAFGTWLRAALDDRRRAEGLGPALPGDLRRLEAAVARWRLVGLAALAALAAAVAWSALRTS